MYKTFLENQPTVLIVYAHPEPKSFNGALKDTAVSTFQKQGYNVIVSDLYGQHFQPVLSKSDINGKLKDANHFNYATEICEAYKGGCVSDDIKAEIEKVKRADLIIFQFPIQWCSVPAILKGWFERVLINGFAFEFPKMLDCGLMKGKKAMLSFTTGSPEGMFSPIGLIGDINVILWPIQYCTLRFCGFDILPPQCTYSPGYADDAQRKAILTGWENRLMKIRTEKPIEFPSMADYDAQKMFILSDKFQQENKDKDAGPSVGQHMGKKLPQ